jgi:hypothetical protein
MLCGTNEAQFSDFPNDFREARVCRRRQAASLQGAANLPLLLQKAAASSGRKIEKCVQDRKFAPF